MARNIYPRGSRLTLLWHFARPDGQAFALDGYDCRLFYSIGSRRTMADSITVSGNVVSWVFITGDDTLPGDYRLQLDIYQNGEKFLSVKHERAFAIYRRGHEASQEEEQEEVNNVVEIYTVAEYYLLQPIIPTVGPDKYWYANGVKVQDSQGNWLSAEHTLRYDTTTKYLIIDEGRVDAQGESIQQTITDVADALAHWASQYAAAEQNRNEQYASAEAVRNASYNRAEATRDDRYAAAEAARETLFSTQEEQRQAYERQRRTDELNRRSNEQVRMSNESTRQNSEGIRQSNEQTRLATEARMLAVLENIVINFLADSDLYEQAVEQGFVGTRDEWLTSVWGVKGVGVESITQVGTSVVGDGINTIRVTLTNGTTADFTVRNGTGIASVAQIETSLISGGNNVIRVTLTNGNTSDFAVRNGQQGDSGYRGEAGELRVANTLSDTDATAALSAAMGKLLADTRLSFGETQTLTAQQRQMAQSNLGIVVLSESEYAALTVKDPSKIYYTYEDEEEV